MDPLTWSQCSKIAEQQFTCEGNFPWTDANDNSCEISPLKPTNQDNCHYEEVNNSSIWVKLYRQNSWIFKTFKQESAHIRCSNSMEDIINLSGQGILSLAEGCMARIRGTTLTSSSNLQSSAIVEELKPASQEDILIISLEAEEEYCSEEVFHPYPKYAPTDTKKQGPKRLTIEEYRRRQRPIRPPSPKPQQKRRRRDREKSTDTEDYMQIQVSNQHPIGFEPPKPPPPPPMPMQPLIYSSNNNNEKLNTVKSINTLASPTNPDTATRKQHQPLSAISIQDLNSVQLRRTDTQKAPKPFQMPARSLSMQCLSSTTDTYLKTDLIAELKISKDIPGIKKMKVEKQMANRMDSEHYSEITKQFTANNYVDQIYMQIPDKDPSGNVIPDWKRQMLAKKAAERAKKDFEDRMAKEAESRRLSQIPQWKRDLLARREETENKLKATIYTPKVEENNRIAETWRLKNRAMSIDNISMVSCTTDIIAYQSNNKENNCGIEMNGTNEKPIEDDMHKLTEKSQDDDDANDNIIPWRAQLRKTNSRLSLV
ncbi:uncharacterized protein LOC119667715 [Teleopsis dalmanni]|uniref:uncharacterized protein LOC119667715 n=2 Tax=Teleopsis dalmanni TaxID=139649 RepID=UPI0018CFD007|nr:uncharacterized protein LOC119667715 [Teleopsis dalmanni]